MIHNYLQEALHLVKRVFPNTEFDYRGDITLRHTDGIIYGVSIIPYKYLDETDMTDSQKAVVVARDIVTLLVFEIIPR